MGTRINYEILGEDGQVICLLFSNCSHPTHHAETIFHVERKASVGPTELVETLLRWRYPTNGGNHRAGDRIFLIDPMPYDREKVVRVTALDCIA